MYRILAGRVGFLSLALAALLSGSPLRAETSTAPAVRCDDDRPTLSNL